MKKLIPVLFSLFFVLPFFTTAQIIRTQGAVNTSMDYNRLKRIDTLVETYLKNNWIKGLVTLVVKDNQVVQYKGYGYQDAAAKQAMPPDAIFRIMSQTKAITSVGIMILYEQGKLLLDEPIANYISEFRHPVVLDKYSAADTTYTTIPAKREITFRDLLTHSSGIDYAAIGSASGTAIYAKAGIPIGVGYYNESLLGKMKILARLPLQFQPGERWQYGLNTDVLGALIEVISGTNLETFFRHHIFEPLGMKDTWFNLPADRANRLAAVYTEDSLHQVINWGHTFRNIDADYPLIKKSYFSGGAGLSSTAMDYAVFLQMLLNGGVYNGHRILAPTTVKMMTSGQLPYLMNAYNNFGLGFEITSKMAANRTPRSEGSFAWGGYFGTTYWVDPQQHLICLIMTQHTPNSHSDLGAKIESLIYSSIIK